MRTAALVLAAVLLALVPASPAAADELARAEPAAADRELLRAVMAAERVETETPRPGLMLYLRDVMVVISRAMERWLGRVLPGLSDLAGPLANFALQLLGLALALVLLLALARYLRRRLAARPAAPAPAAPFERLPVAGVDGGSAEQWRERLHRRLGEGRVDEAVEALWWWLASVLVPRGAEPSWTSRELLGRAGRGDLLPLVRRLDRMLYGAARPSTGEVDGLWRALREAVA